MMAFNIDFYKDSYEHKWDEFVLNKSMNGTFLQTRKFINYHREGKFEDCSLIVRKGDEIVAVVLACQIYENNKKTFYAHKGTTFGGITICRTIYSASNIDELISGIIEFLKNNDFEKIYIKLVPDIYQKQNANLLDYFLVKYNFMCYNELNYFLDLPKYKEDIASQFSSSKRRDYRYSLKSEFVFKKLDTKADISTYYDVLIKNLKKLNLTAVHSLDDLYDLYFNRFKNEIEFYGVYYKDTMVAGSMLFYLGNNIVHTQYLSSDEDYLKLFPMDFLVYNLIKVGVEKGRTIFSFGICTENQGRYLNLGLSRFKEGFGTEFCINRSYEKNL